MNFRWSDGYRYAVEFAADEQSLAGEMAKALKTFCMETAKRFHAGELRKNRIRFKEAQLHVQINGIWTTTGGRIVNTPGVPTHFENKCFVSFADTIDDTTETINDFFERQAFALLVNSPDIMVCVTDTHRWMGSLTNLALDVGHKLKEMTDENQ